MNRSFDRRPHAAPTTPMRPLSLLIGLAFGLPMPAAFAQDAAPAASGASAPAVPGVLPAVTVTAERRAENIKDVPSSIGTISSEALDVHQHRRPGPAGPVRPRAQPEHRILVRPRLSALLHPWLRQHRLPSQRLAAGVAGLRRRGAGEPDPEGLPGFRPGPRRGAARPAGHAVRAQQRRPAWSSSSRRRPTRRTSSGYGRPVDRQPQHRRTPKVRQRADSASRRRCASRCSIRHRDDWVDNTYARSPRRATSKATDDTARACSSCSGRARTSARWPTCTRATSTARHACSAPTSSSRAATPSSPDSIEREIAIDGKNESRLRNSGANLRLRWDLGR